MARTAHAIQEVPANSAAQLVGATPDAVNGTMFENTGKEVLVVHNGDVSAKTVTIVSVPCSHGRTGDVQVVVAAGSRAEFGPFAPELFSQKSGADIGKAYVNWSASTSVSATVRRTT